jgi:hypothetical protein
MEREGERVEREREKEREGAAIRNTKIPEDPFHLKFAMNFSVCWLSSLLEWPRLQRLFLLLNSPNQRYNEGLGSLLWN